MFQSKNNKNAYPCKPQFYYIKVGSKEVYITRTCYRDGLDNGVTRKDLSLDFDLQEGKTLQIWFASSEYLDKHGYPFSLIHIHCPHG